MKLRFLAILFIAGVSSTLRAQSSVSTEESAAIIDVARPYIKTILGRYSCEYIKGGVTINRRSGRESSSTLTYKGSVRYESPNCNTISADLTVSIIRDGSDVSLSEVCIYMPTCLLGSPMDIYNWRCEKSE